MTGSVSCMHDNILSSVPMKSWSRGAPGGATRGHAGVRRRQGEVLVVVVAALGRGDEWEVLVVVVRRLNGRGGRAAWL